LLDGDDSHAYQTALSTWSEAIDDPDKTLSGRVINEVVVKGTDHSVWVKQLANDYHDFLTHYPLSHEVEKAYEDEAKKSLLELQSLEAQPQDNFATFLQDYFRDVVPAGTFEAK
jgi:glutamate--cysteine ligase